MREQDEKMRDEFEEFAKSEGYFMARYQDFGAYVDSDTAFVWLGWKASRAQSDLAHQADREELASAKLLLEWQKLEIARLRSWQGSHEQVLNRNEELMGQLATAQLVIEQKDALIFDVIQEWNNNSMNGCLYALREALAIQPSPSALNEERAKVLTGAKRDLSSIQEDASCLCTSCWQYVERNIGHMITELRNEKKGG